MGAEVTIDKHTSALEEWLEIQDKLEGINYEEEVSNHVAAWKFFGDEANPQEFNSLAVDLDLQAVPQLLSPHDAYLLIAIRNHLRPLRPAPPAALALLAAALRQNIDQPTYLTPIVSARTDSTSYYVYAYLGKLCKPKIRLVTLSYALKAEQLLNSKKKLAILSGGGVLRNKKLQKGSTLTLVPTTPTTPTSNPQLKDSGDWLEVDIVRVFLEERRPHPLMGFRARRSAFIQCEEKAAVVERGVERGVEKVGGGVKPPMLKLSLKPFEEVSYS